MQSLKRAAKKIALRKSERDAKKLLKKKAKNAKLAGANDGQVDKIVRIHPDKRTTFNAPEKKALDILDETTRAKVARMEAEREYEAQLKAEFVENVRIEAAEKEAERKEEGRIMGERIEAARTEQLNKRKNIQHRPWDTPDYRLKAKEALPEGWDDEDDIDEDDIQARIERCERRIQQNILPNYFELKKQGLGKRQKTLDAIYEAEPEVPHLTAQRIDTLKKIQKHLVDNGDPCNELPNIAAIIEAYRSGEMIWDGKISCWHGGLLVSGPSDLMKWSEFKMMNGYNRGDVGFWIEGVEGIDRPGPSPARYQSAVCLRPDFQTEYMVQLDVRLGENMDTVPATMPPVTPANEHTLDFVDDTGAEHFLMYKDDMMKLMGPNARPTDYPWPQVMGYSLMVTASGDEYPLLMVAVQVNIKDIGRNHMLGWSTVACYFSEKTSTENDIVGRLCPGKWLRQRFFQATAPEHPQYLYLSTHKSGLLHPNMLPTVTPESILVDPVHLPAIAAGYRIERGVRVPVQRPRQRGRNPQHPRPLREVAPEGPPPFAQ